MNKEIEELKEIYPNVEMTDELRAAILKSPTLIGDLKYIGKQVTGPRVKSIPITPELVKFVAENPGKPKDPDHNPIDILITGIKKIRKQLTTETVNAAISLARKLLLID